MSDQPNTPAPTPAPAPPAATPAPAPAPQAAPQPPSRDTSGDLASLQARLEELSSAYEQTQRANTALRERLDLVDAGLTDASAHDVARLEWQRLPEADRPPLAEWVRSQVDNPSQASRGLRGYLSAPAAAPESAPAGVEAAPPPPAAPGAAAGGPSVPLAPTGVAGAAPQARVDPKSVLQARTAELARARQLGDVAAIADARKAVAAALAARVAGS